jgi:hypothetical protein
MTMAKSIVKQKPRLGAAPVKTFYTQPMGDIASERLEKQYSRILQVVEEMETARGIIDSDRMGLVCGIDIGEQTEALAATNLMWSSLKLAAETLIEIANKIDPLVVWERGTDGYFETTIPATH